MNIEQIMPFAWDVANAASQFMTSHLPESIQDTGVSNNAIAGVATTALGVLATQEISKKYAPDFYQKRLPYIQAGVGVLFFGAMFTFDYATDGGLTKHPVYTPPMIASGMTGVALALRDYYKRKIAEREQSHLEEVSDLKAELMGLYDSQHPTTFTSTTTPNLELDAIADMPLARPEPNLALDEIILK